MLGQPSVIARLMGMEFEAPTIVLTPAAAAVVIQAEDAAVNLLKSPSKVKPFKCTSLPHHGRINGDYYRYCLNKMKPRRRSRRSSSTSSSRGHRHDRHPQEELLEKIKEDFRASWQQASMAAEPVTEGGESTVASASGRRSSAGAADRAGWVDGRFNIQRIAQENLCREKIARYGHGAHKTKVEDEDDGITPHKAGKAEQEQQGSSESIVAVSEQDSEELSGALDAEPEHHGRSTGTPTRIAIHRPIGTAGGADDRGEPALGTPPPSWKALRNGGGMEEFLRAVKERLDSEMKAKTGDGHLVPPATTTRRKGWGSEEARGDTVRRIRESAGMAREDLGRRLSRLESFRVFRGDRGRRDAAAVKSPEHRMLKSVRARIEAMSPKKTRLSGPTSPVSSRGGRVWSSPPADAGHASSLSGVGSEEEEEGGQSCCRGDQQRAMTRLWKVHGAAPTADTGVGVSPSPRALVRSFSAPVPSAISSGGPETASLSRSRSFSLLRTTVASGLRQSFSLGGKLLMTMIHLSKKIPLTTMMYSSSTPQDSSHLITAAQTCVLLPWQANLLAGLAPPSPVSPLEVQRCGARHFAGDPSCTFLLESSPKRSPKCSSEQFDGSVIGGESPWRWKADAAAASVDDPDKAYIRELLIAAGLFDDDDDARSSQDTATATTISSDVFYEVEDAYYYRYLRRRVDEDGSGEEEEEDGSPDRRRLLFDLANEALQAYPSSPSRSRLRGRELADDVWRQVAREMAGDGSTAPAMTVDGMVEREIGMSPWMALREDVYGVGRKIERAIFDELVVDVVRQLFVLT